MERFNRPQYFICLLASNIQLIALLQIQPESSAHTQPFLEAQGGAGSHCSFSGNKLRSPIRWHMQFMRQFSRAYVQFSQFIGQYLTWMNGIALTFLHGFSPGTSSVLRAIIGL